MRSAQCILEIDLTKIRANYRIIAQFCKTAGIASVVKANGYGLGANFVAPALQKAGCKNFFVTTVDEGIRLRKVLPKECNILIFNGVFSDDVQEFREHNLIPVLNNLQQVGIWQEFVIHKKNTAINNSFLPCAIHINTGLNRLGMSMGEIKQIEKEPRLLDSLNLLYIISHLSDSEAVDSPHNQKQLIKFKHYLSFFPNTKASLSNSSGVFLGQDYHFDLIRAGAALYGINPIKNSLENLMNNPVRLTAPIIHIQELPSEDYIGYNMTFKTRRNSLIATLPLGYADGYSRSFSNYGEVFIDSHKAPIVGRISMDLMTIDVTEIPPQKIFLGQDVEIIGNNCTPDKIANIINTISYEIITTLGNRYKKVYKDDF